MRKKRQIKQKNKGTSLQYYIISIACTIFIMILIFNDFGLITYFHLKNQHAKLDEDLNKLFVQQNNLRLELDRLQNDQNYIEQIAREKFMMVKPGERVYRVQEIKEIDKK